MDMMEVFDEVGILIELIYGGEGLRVLKDRVLIIVGC